VNTKKCIVLAAALLGAGAACEGSAEILSYERTAYWTVADMRRELRMEEADFYARFESHSALSLLKEAKTTGRALTKAEKDCLQGVIREGIGKGLPPYLQIVLFAHIFHYFATGDQQPELWNFIQRMEANQNERRYVCNVCERCYFGQIDDSVSLLSSGASAPGEAADTEKDLLSCGHTYCPRCINLAGGAAKGSMLCLVCAEGKEFKS